MVLFCEELKNSTEMIMGPQTNIYPVPLLPSEGAEDFKEKFLSVVENLDDYIVFADLLGGTPCNVVSRFIDGGIPFRTLCRYEYADGYWFSKRCFVRF